jgi:hypothetical protein
VDNITVVLVDIADPGDSRATAAEEEPETVVVGSEKKA